MNKNIKLGTKVKCKGYIVKKKNIEYIYANKRHFKKDMGIFGDDIEEPKFYIEDLGEYTQKITEIKNKEFVGIVVGITSIATKYYYTQVEKDIFDPITYGYVYTQLLDQVKVEKSGYIDCFKVYYAMGKSRFVPVNLLEKE